MTRTLTLAVLISASASLVAGCATPGHRYTITVDPGEPVGRVEQVVLVPGTDKKPSIIETKGYVVRARIQFHCEITRGNTARSYNVCYVALIDANSRVRFLADGGFYVERGAIYVDSDCRAVTSADAAASDDPELVTDFEQVSTLPIFEINAMYLPPNEYVPATQPTAPDDWTWVSTSRVEAGAEGSAIVVHVDPDSGYHRVFFLKGTSAFVIVDNKKTIWDEKSKFQEVNVWRHLRTKSLSSDPVVHAWLKSFMARIAAAGIKPV